MLIVLISLFAGGLGNFKSAMHNYHLEFKKIKGERKEKEKSRQPCGSQSLENVRKGPRMCISKGSGPSVVLFPLSVVSTAGLCLERSVTETHLG